MRAVRYDRFGPVDVLDVREAPDPRPRRGEVRVRVHAAALNPKDVLLRKGKLAWAGGRRFPKGTGHDLAGVVDAVGPGDVGGIAVGDEVFGMINGFRARTAAGHVTLPAGEVARKPATLDFVEAAAVPLAALTALQALRDDARLEAGERVLVNGASGGVGTFAVQIATILGGEVTGICSHRNVELVRSLGARDVVDYGVEDAFAGTQRWDVVFDVFGNRSFDEARRVLARGGRYVSTVPSPRIVWDTLRTLFRPRRARLVVVKSRRRDLEALARWIDAGSLRPVIDQVYPLDAVRDAHAHLETKRTRGKVVVRVGPA